ncbi:MAG: universal stress protein [Candidatus Cloacimonetes bacterium]|nr:universal stress protein [Candidatus Cloacimonadota bacterium]
MKKIIVPVDFSENTECACDYALKFAAKEETEILLFHAYMYPIATADMTDDVVDSSTLITPEIMDSIEQAAHAGMKRLKDKLDKKIKEEKVSTIKLKTKVTNGMVEYEILDGCDTYNPDLVIMSSSGQGHTSGKLLGSIALKILEHAAIPVMTIPDGTKFKKIRNVLYITDFDESDITAIESLLSILDPFKVKIHCLHVEHSKKDMLDNMLMDYLKKHFENEFKKEVMFFEIVQDKDVSKAVEEYIKEKDIDLVGLLHHKRGLLSKIFHPSMTKKIFYQTGLPILTFHDTAEEDDSIE